jgi:hypothetical protein
MSKRGGKPDPKGGPKKKLTALEKAEGEAKLIQDIVSPEYMKAIRIEIRELNKRIA